MGCKVSLADGCALLVSGIKRGVLLPVSLRHDEYHATLVVSDCWVGSLLLENPNPHHQWARGSGVPSAEEPIGSGRHVVLLCGVEREFLLHGALRWFEYHSCFCCKMQWWGHDRLEKPKPHHLRGSMTG